LKTFQITLKGLNFSTYKDLTLKTSRLYADKDHTVQMGFLSIDHPNYRLELLK